MTPRHLGLAAALLLACATQSSAQQPALQIGMVQGMFRDMQPAMVQAIAKPLRNIIQQQTGMSGNIEIVADGKTLSEQMAEPGSINSAYSMDMSSPGRANSTPTWYHSSSPCRRRGCCARSWSSTPTRH